VNENVATTSFDLNEPTEISLFIIVDQSSSPNLSPIDITINLDQSSDSLSSINEIRISLLVTHANFTINNETTKVYTPSDIPILLWQNSSDNNYDLIDLFQLDNQQYETDTSVCQWSISQWDRLFSGNKSINLSYAYILKTINPQLAFTLIDTSNISAMPSPPTPYLNILYCIPYKLGITEILLIALSGFLFFVSVVILSILHYRKVEEHQMRHFQRSHIRGGLRRRSKIFRRRTSASMSSMEHDDQASD
jgi:hypothetical protein